MWTNGWVTNKNIIRFHIPNEKCHWKIAMKHTNEIYPSWRHHYSQPLWQWCHLFIRRLGERERVVCYFTAKRIPLRRQNRPAASVCVFQIQSKQNWPRCIYSQFPCCLSFFLLKIFFSTFNLKKEENSFIFSVEKTAMFEKIEPLKGCLVDVPFRVKKLKKLASLLGYLFSLLHLRKPKRLTSLTITTPIRTPEIYIIGIGFFFFLFLPAPPLLFPDSSRPSVRPCVIERAELGGFLICICVFF